MTITAMPAVVQKGWYRMSLTDGRRYTGQCLVVKGNVFVFDIGLWWNASTNRKQNLRIDAVDLKTLTRLSPRYIEEVITRSQGWTKKTYKGLMAYGEI